jgi:hypothetical protein
LVTQIRYGRFKGKGVDQPAIRTAPSASSRPGLAAVGLAGLLAVLMATVS